MYARSCISCYDMGKLTHNKSADYKLEELLYPVCLYECMCYTVPSDIFLNLPEAKKWYNKQASLDTKAKLCFLSSGSFFVFYQPILALLSSPPPLLTGCHHIFSQLPTTSYSATTDLNTDLASSVPLRRERERYHTLSLPPLCCRVEFCLSHQSSGCWSTPCYFFPISTRFAFQLIRARTGKHCSWLNKRVCHWHLYTP